jgi:hypothetical protein
MLRLLVYLSPSGGPRYDVFGGLVLSVPAIPSFSRWRRPIVQHVARTSIVFDPEEPCHRAVSSTRAEGALLFGGVDLSSATITYA